MVVNSDLSHKGFHMNLQAPDKTSLALENLRYYIGAPWLDQYFVDVGQQTVSCKKWKLTRIPSKLAIVDIWDIGKNSKDVGTHETWDPFLLVTNVEGDVLFQN